MLRRVGLPTLALLAGLVLPAGSAVAQSPILHDQYGDGTSAPFADFPLSSKFCEIGTASCTSYEAADDFLVPSRHTWTVDRVEVDGHFESNGQPLPDLVVRFYDVPRGLQPTELVAAVPVAAGVYSSSSDGDLTIPIAPTALGEGHYFVSVQAQVPQERVCAGGCSLVSRRDPWSWRKRSVVTLDPALADRPECRFCDFEDEDGNLEDLVFRLRGTDPLPAGASKEQQVAVAPDGRAVFTWLRWNGSNWIAQARARAADGTLSAIQRLSEPGRDAARPQVAIDDEGDAVFTWLHSNDANDVVQARARAAGGTLSAIQTLSSPGQDAFGPRVDVDADGDAVFAWLRRDGSNLIAQTRARSAGGTLSGVQNLSSRGADAGPLGVAVDADGDAVFVWQRGGRIQARRRAAAGALTAIQSLDDSGVGPDVGVDDAGNAVFSWARSSVSSVLVTRRRAVDGTLSPVRSVSSGGDAFGYPNAQMAVEPDGDAVFVWESHTYSGDDNFIAIKARRRAADGTLSRVNTLATTGTRPDVAVDAGGDAVFAWSGGGPGGEPMVKTRRRAQDGALSPVQNLGVGTLFPIPRVGVDDAGDALFAWQADNTSWDLIRGRHRAEGGALSTPFTLSD